MRGSPRRIPRPGQVEAAARLRALLAGSALFRPGVPRRVQGPDQLPMRHPRAGRGSHGARLGARRDRGGTERRGRQPADPGAGRRDPVDRELPHRRDGDRLRRTAAGAGAGRHDLLAAHGAAPRSRDLGPRGTNRDALRVRSSRAPQPYAQPGKSRDCSNPVSNDDATPFGVEDQAPFTLQAVRRTAAQIAILQQVLACEMIVAAQALDLRPLAPSAPTVQALHAVVRRHVSFLDEDRGHHGRCGASIDCRARPASAGAS